LVGLGNPGQRYADTRHNLGRVAVEAFASRHGIALDEIRHGCRFGRGDLAGLRVCVATPTGYMNESGRCVAALARYYRVPPDRVLLFYDDLDLPVGALRVRPSGGAGGHNGVASSLSALGASNVPRVRLGVGRPPVEWDAADYVLARFAADERPAVAACVDRAVAAAEAILTDGVDVAMNAYN
jgi:PTH1 family peptidyl-tRNA hydrolase